MTEKIPRVSVGVPVYNGEKYVLATLESILNQTYTDLELIVSDNGSTDGTQAICEALAARDPRVRYYREEENRGAPWNIDRVVELARTEYFKWQSADDTLDPTFVEKCVEILDREPNVELAMSRALPIDGAGKLIDIAAMEAKNGGKSMRFTDDEEPYRWDYLTSTYANRRYKGLLMYSIRCFEEFGLVRLKTMRKTGLHRKYVGSEKVFCTEMALTGPWREIPEVLFFNRWHDDRFSAIDSAVGQLQWVDPKAKPRFVLPRQVRCTLGYFWAIFRMEMRWYERVACLGVLTQFVFRISKWKKVFLEFFRGAGGHDRDFA